MAEPILGIDPELEARLRDLAPHVAFPPTPDLATAVQARLAAQPRQPLARPWRPWFAWRWPRLSAGRPLAVALVALVALFAAYLALSPSAREAVANRLGLGGITITHVSELPTLPPTPPGATLGLGERVSLEEARARLGFEPRLPDLGPPDAVYVAAGQVSLIYAPRPGLPPTAETGVGLLLTEFRGSVDPGLFGKGLPPSAHLEEVRVGGSGSRGFWISGAPHVFFYRDANGSIHDERSRLAGNTLLWQHDELTFRLEAAIDRDAALRIAASVTP